MQDSSLAYKLKEYKNPLVLFLIGTLVGIIFYFQNLSIFICVIFVVLFMIIITFISNKYIPIVLFSVVLGYFYPYFRIELISDNFSGLIGKEGIFIGEILSGADKRNLYNNRYFFRIKHIYNGDNLKDTNLKVQVYGSTYEEYSPGDIVQIKGLLKHPKGPILPGLFDNRKYLLTKDIKYVLNAKQGTLVFLDKPKSTFLRRFIYIFREKLISKNRSRLPRDNLALINGIVFGSKASNLENNLKDKITALGLAHITSASGFNVSILAAFIFYLLKLFTKSKTIPSIISIFAIVFYAALADFSMSVIRATIFIVLILIANLFNKKIKPLPGVCFIVLLFFIFNPVSLLDIGLQLSVFAFLGLILFLPEVKNKISELNKAIQFFVLIFFQSLIAQIVVSPLIVFYFHDVQIMGIVSNLLAVPLAAAILTIGLLSVFIPDFFILKLFVDISDFILKMFSEIFLWWINFLYNLPFINVFIPSISFFLLILIYLLIFYALCALFLEKFRRYIKIFAFCILLIFFSYLAFINIKKELNIFCIKKYNRDYVLVTFKGKNPVIISKKINDRDLRLMEEYCRLSYINPEFDVYNLNEKQKVKIKYRDFSFSIINDYKNKIIDNSFCVKLPLLSKSHPDFSFALNTIPECIIVNDYKKLSYYSKENINWLKHQNTNLYLLSETGTVVISSDGKRHKIKMLR